MKKRIERKGKQMLPVMSNKIYSALLFEIASGNNYAQKIYDSIKKPTSIIVRQLKILEEKDFVTSVFEEDKSTFPMKRLNIYSINWNKILQEFVRYVFDGFKEEHQNYKRIKDTLKNNSQDIHKSKDEKYDKLMNEIENKNFEKIIEENNYLKFFVKRKFFLLGASHIDKTIKNVFEELRLELTIQKEIFIFEDREYSRKIEEESKKDVAYKQLNTFREICKGVFDLDTRQNLLDLDTYIKLKYSLICCPSHENTKDLIKSAPDYLIKDLIENHPDLKEVIQKTKENDFNATKPTENIENKSGDTHQNKPLSSENKQETNSK